MRRAELGAGLNPSGAQGITKTRAGILGAGPAGPLTATWRRQLATGRIRFYSGMVGETTTRGMNGAPTLVSRGTVCVASARDADANTLFGKHIRRRKHDPERRPLAFLALDREQTIISFY